MKNYLDFTSFSLGFFTGLFIGLPWILILRKNAMKVKLFWGRLIYQTCEIRDRMIEKGLWNKDF